MCISVAVRHKQLDCVTLVIKLILMTSSELLEGSIRIIGIIVMLT